DRIRAGRIPNLVVAIFARVDAIEEQFIRLLAIAVNVWTPRRSDQAGRAERCRVRSSRPGSEQREGKIVASSQGQADLSIGVDDRAYLGALGLQERRSAVDLHNLGHLANSQLKVQARSLIEIKIDRRTHRSFEA